MSVTVTTIVMAHVYSTNCNIETHNFPVPVLFPVPCSVNKPLDVSMDLISFWLNVFADDWTAERAIIGGNDNDGWNFISIQKIGSPTFHTWWLKSFH